MWSQVVKHRQLESSSSSSPTGDNTLPCVDDRVSSRRRTTVVDNLKNIVLEQRFTVVLQFSLLVWVISNYFQEPEELFTPWIMRSSQGPLKSTTGCLSHLGITLVYTKEKVSGQSDHGVQSPQKTYFKAYIIH